MLDIPTTSDLASHVGQKLGTSEWFTVDQKTIDLFAEATGDHQWIHVDVERAKKEMPGGKTIAHGFLTLSLLPRLAPSVYRVVKRSRAINYGTNKVRFTAMVPAGSRVRLHISLKGVEPIQGGVRVTLHNEMELEGNERPCLVAETLAQIYD
ncbi:MaoC family dehydratase [Sabulicella glaciei]|uniref:MaoC family dehydratase n=1 Tax=Sabulicella glaciei TaxID=2984948 RepID=A0ABT3NTM4_9PROT|nr:MaoC family dehydratase [Roseococcus sp. MDT2-1-1]MCW8085507.1 MaoC family dehydratase [Roseococcus sp. MDT2-1-1]